MFIEKIFKGDKRTALIKKNIASSFLIKGWSCIIQFLLVPLTLNCLNQYEYGIWLTINSILIWIDQFDMGLGNGLRNKLAESIATNNKEKAQKQVSTTVIMLFCIIIPIFFVLSLIVIKTNLYELLNIIPAKVPNLVEIILISLAFVCSTFIFKFIGNIYLGLQLPAVNNLLVVSGQTMALLLITILSLLGDKSLLHIAIAYTLSPLIIYIFSSPITFTKYKYLYPKISLFDIKELKELFSLGIIFFSIQLSGLIIFASSNILISRLFSPSEVAPYQITYRYFSIILVVFSLISAPLWTATTDAYTRGEYKWIKKQVAKTKFVVAILGVCLLFMTLGANIFYNIWVGDNIKIDITMSILMALYIFELIYSMCFSNIIFGIGKIKIISYITIIEAIIFIPLAIYLGREIGITGIVIALIIANSLCAISNRIQYSLIINHKV
jgi:O-antigen/teichoic acid export membrane protein